MSERDFNNSSDLNEPINQIQEELKKKNKQIEDLKEKSNQLQAELNKRNNEIVIFSQKIETLEDEIIALRELLSDSSSKKKGKKVKETKLILDLEAKDSEIRQLKDRMGFLRKEKIDVQKQLEKFKDQNKSSSTVLRVEDIREKQPLNMLVKDLQEKIKKQEFLINKLSQEGKNKEFEEIITHKDAKIESLNNKITELNEKLENVGDKVGSESDGTIQKQLLQELQDKLNKVKRENRELTSEIEKYKEGDTTEQNEVKDKGLLESNQEGALDQIVDDLQKKLNKSRTQIQILKTQLAGQNKPQKFSSNTGDQLKIQREMATFLQNQLEDAKNALKTKVEEIGTIKNEAIRIKRKYEELESQLKMKDQLYNDLRSDFESLKIQSQIQVGPNSSQNPQIELRIQELKSQIDDLTKQNIQQRLEINQLRKNE